MGDITPTLANTQPGIMLVRPTLLSPSPSNASAFKRWTIMHFNDLIHCHFPPGPKGISRALRYTNADGQLLYTIHADDISIWKTQPYYAVSRRLDLENTRDVMQGESAVLQGEHGFGTEPMVWQVVDAAFAIFEETARSPGEGVYHDLPDTLVSGRGEELECELVMLTFTPSRSANNASQEEESKKPPKEFTNLRDRALGSLSERAKVYSSMYRHRPDAQPDMHPPIAEGAHGNGTWMACILVEGKVGEEVRSQLQKEVIGVKVGFWKGEVFMS